MRNVIGGMMASRRPHRQRRACCKLQVTRDKQGRLCTSPNIHSYIIYSFEILTVAAPVSGRPMSHSAHRAIVAPVNAGNNWGARRARWRKARRLFAYHCAGSVSEAVEA